MRFENFQNLLGHFQMSLKMGISEISANRLSNASRIQSVAEIPSTLVPEKGITKLVSVKYAKDNLTFCKSMMKLENLLA